MPRRLMRGPNGGQNFVHHSGEHIEGLGCNETPMCTPVDNTEAPADTAAYDPPPEHYDRGGIDPWAVWDAFDLDRYTANAVKYLLRAGKKDIAPRLDDLVKARNYVNKAIEMEERKT